jgi:hypothetical protein
MDAKAMFARLEKIRKADPVADLARDLLEAGVTEEQLHAWLQGKMNDGLGLQLYNKYRDLRISGWTSNYWGVKVRR